MKKILMTIAFAALAIAGANAQVKFGVRAGLNLADVASKTNGVKDETKIRTSFYVGGLAEFTLRPKKVVTKICNIPLTFLYGLSMILQASVLKRDSMQVIWLSVKQNGVAGR